MNDLRIDVILDTERRSASPVSVRLVLRSAGLVVGTILLLFTTLFVVKVKGEERKRDLLAAEWAKMEPKLNKARFFQKAVEENQHIVDEIRGWRNARLLWSRHLGDYQKVIPDQIQLTSLQVSDQILMMGESAGRCFRIGLKGKALSVEAKEDVDSLLAKLKNDAGFADMVKDAKVVDFGQLAGGEKHHRQFEIHLEYKPRMY